MDVEEICSGWLIKSPSSKYVTLFSRGKISIKVPLRSVSKAVVVLAVVTVTTVVSVAAVS